MIYSQLYFNSIKKNRYSLFVIFLVFITLFLITLFLKLLFFKTPTKSRASKIYLKRLEVVNVSYNKVDIFWETNEKEISWIMYGRDKKNLSKLALDIRDISEKRSSYIYHLATLGNNYDLKPNTTYFFKILSKGRVYAIGDEDIFSFRTPKFFNLKVGKNFAYGKVFKENSSPLNDAFVILNIPSMFPMAVLSKSTGEWFINLSDVVSREERTISNVSDDTVVTIEILYGNKKSSIKARVSDLKPLQPVVLGRNYDFTVQPQVLSANSIRNNMSQKSNIEIVYPRENAVISVNYPLIKGTGIPGKEVLIIVKSDRVYSARVRVNKKGLWTLKVPLKLSVGKHKLIIKTTDENNKNVTLERNFYIAKSGESVLGEATSSAELTPTLMLSKTPTPTPIPTALPTKSITQSPTTIISPTTPVTGFDARVFTFLGILFLGGGISFLLFI